ncbi:hypothetical protein Q7P37_006377 [Cladosporium fusiforme]
MEFETPDGSRFYLQEILGDEASGHAFKYTSITAFVDGKPYAASSEQHMDDVDCVDLLDVIQPVPLDNINPRCPAGFLHATSPNPEAHYLKTPFFTYEDSKPGCTFIADCLLGEATALEKLRHHPHPNVVEYLGCVVSEGRITQLCLKQYEGNLQDHTQPLSKQQRDDIFEGVVSAVKHLHDLGLAHNDIGPQNICLDSAVRPVIVDFDACLPFGTQLLKGVGAEKWGGRLVSDPENDFQGLDDLKDWLDDYAADT